MSSHGGTCMSMNMIMVQCLRCTEYYIYISGVYGVVYISDQHHEDDPAEEKNASSQAVTTTTKAQGHPIWLVEPQITRTTESAFYWHHQRTRLKNHSTNKL